MSRPGMTILELLLALALLSGLAIACISWTTAATRALTEQGGDAAWRQGAQATLAFIDDAIATEDRSTGRTRETWRVTVEPRRLTLRSRQVVATDSGAPALAETIELATADGSLIATYRDAEGRQITERPLLGRAGGLEVAVTEIDRTASRLVVTIHAERGGHAERAWTFAPGELR